MNSRFVQHIDGCLTCRSCEVVCPRNVAYGQLIDNTRAMMATSLLAPLRDKTVIQKSWLRLLIEQEFIAKPTRFDTLRSFLRFYQKLGLQRLLNKLGLLKKTKLAAKSLWRMQSAFFLEEKVGKGLGGSKILFSKVQKRS